MKKYILFGLLFSLIATGCIHSNKDFVTENLGVDKYTQIQQKKSSNNWVKSDQKYDVGFNLLIGTKEEWVEKDCYLVLSVDNGFKSSSFQIGDHLLLTINGTETLRLKPTCLLCRGSFSSYSPSLGEDCIFLTKEMVQKMAWFKFG